MPFVLYSFGPLQHNLHGQIIYIQAILQPPIAASFWSLVTSRKHHTGYFRDRRRSKHYHLRRTARLRPIERPFRDPMRQFSRPSTWLWHRRTPLVARYGFSRSLQERPFFWQPNITVYRTPPCRPTKISHNDKLSERGTRHIDHRESQVVVKDDTMVVPPEPPDSSDDQLKVHNCDITYSVSNHTSKKRKGSLVDRGANGGVAGDDVRIINKSLRTVDIQGLDNHQIKSVPIVTAGGVMQTQNGDVIVILHQYAYHGKGKTIHSSGQLEWYKNDVNEKSVKVGGYQHLQTIDGYTIPINICDGLAYMKLRPYTEIEFASLPMVILTSDADWDPSVLDHQMDDDDNWYDAVHELERNPNADLFDEFGDYRHRREVGETNILPAPPDTRDLDDIIDDCAPSSDLLQVHDRSITPSRTHYETLRPLFG